MAKVSVSVDVRLPPEKAWECASDLSRYKEWLSIHRVWRSKLPETLEKGTVVESIVEVKGMPNRIKWTIVHFKPPEAMTLNGDGRGGVTVKLIGKVKPSEKDSGGSTVTFDVHLGGPALFGPIGMVVAGALKGDIRESLNTFKSVFAPAVQHKRPSERWWFIVGGEPGLALSFFFGDEFGSFASFLVDAVAAVLFAGLLAPRHHHPAIGGGLSEGRYRQLTRGLR